MKRWLTALCLIAACACARAQAPASSQAAVWHPAPGLEQVPICVAYDVDGERHDEMPMTQTGFHHAKPIYEYMPGWFEDISSARTFEDLPANAQAYVRRIEELSQARVSAIGVGPGRDQTIVLHDPLA